MPFESYIQSINATIENLTGGNQIMSGAIVLWLLGVGSYSLRVVPSKVFSFLVKHTTTEVTVNNSDMVFIKLHRWLSQKCGDYQIRKIKFTDFHDGVSRGTKDIGYGDHIIWLGWIPLRISFYSIESQSTNFKEVLTITKLGRSHKLFDYLLKEIRKEEPQKKSVWSINGEMWQHHLNTVTRDFNSLAILESQKKKIKETLDNFQDSESWYIDKSIPYKLGILFSGPPGTGKTSVIKAIANYMDKHICICKSKSLGKLDDIIARMPSDSILVIEDIDSSSLVKDRGLDTKDNITIDMNDDCSSLSEVLNAIDGVIGSHGLIIIMTTNHKEKLDPALIRPGRVDLDIEIGYLTEETFLYFLGRFFDDVPNSVNLKKDNITGAQLQQDILSGMNIQNILNKHTYMKSSSNRLVLQSN